MYIRAHVLASTGSTSQIIILVCVNWDIVQSTVCSVRFLELPHAHTRGASTATMYQQKLKFVRRGTTDSSGNEEVLCV